MSLIVVGTMAFDAIETPFGKIDRIIGGSATYVAYTAANFITPIQQVSVIGDDFPDEELAELEKRGVDLKCELTKIISTELGVTKNVGVSF